MAILLLFNHAQQLTIETIQDLTQIKTNLLIEILNSLIESKILVSKQPITSINFNMNLSIRLSDEFLR